MSHATILLVEDDRDIREILADILIEQGFGVVTAENGQQALATIRGSASPPAAILLDLMMPVMDGYAFLEERRKDPALASIAVAVITAGHTVDRARLGQVPIIWKPIDLTRLLRVLKDLGVQGNKESRP